MCNYWHTVKEERRREDGEGEKKGREVGGKKERGEERIGEDMRKEERKGKENTSTLLGNSKLLVWDEKRKEKQKLISHYPVVTE